MKLIRSKIDNKQGVSEFDFQIQVGCIVEERTFIIDFNPQREIIYAGVKLNDKVTHKIDLQSKEYADVLDFCKKEIIKCNSKN